MQKPNRLLWILAQRHIQEAQKHIQTNNTNTSVTFQSNDNMTPAKTNTVNPVFSVQPNI